MTTPIEALNYIYVKFDVPQACSMPAPSIVDGQYLHQHLKEEQWDAQDNSDASKAMLTAFGTQYTALREIPKTYMTEAANLMMQAWSEEWSR